MDATRFDITPQLATAVYLAWAIALAPMAWVLVQVFGSFLHKVHPRDRERYVLVCWGWMICHAIFVIQSANMAVLGVVKFLPVPVSKIFSFTMPDKSDAVITMVGWCCLLALALRGLPMLRPTASPRP